MNGTVAVSSLLPELNDSLFDGNLTNYYDEAQLGHQYPLWKVILISVVAACLSLVTVIGNIMVMVSFKIDKQLQTISNYFLFSLAVADFAIGLISMPLFTVYTVLGYWPLGSHVCDTWLALDYLASNASVLNLLIISFDRYFSVTRPLTYRAKRTTVKAGIMIACAWGISLLLWPPWIYAWPYIEGERTVPEYSCYIQFIETNHYITFGTAIAAFYVPVSVMAYLYYRIWLETEKRQKDLPNLQANKPADSKRSNSSDEALDMEEGWRPRSESSTGANDDVNSTHIAVSYLNRHYPQHRKHRPLSWTWLKMWCVAWWHSGRDDDDEEDDEDEAGGPESSRTVPGYDEAITPVSLETPVPSVTSRCDSAFSTLPSHSVTLDRFDHPAEFRAGHRTPGAASAATISSRNMTNDSQVYTILIRLPGPPMPPRSGKEAQILGRYNAVEAPSIKMFSEDMITFHATRQGELPSPGGSEIIVADTEITRDNEYKTFMRRSSQMSGMHDVRIPLSAKNITKATTTTTTSGGSGTKVTAIKAAPAKKKKKSQEKKADKKAAKTLSAILAAFIITWTPYNILVLLKPLTACTGCIPQELWDFFIICATSIVQLIQCVTHFVMPLSVGPTYVY